MTATPDSPSERVTIAASDVTSRKQLEAIPDEIRGLWATPKTLPPKLFYDARGAELFERISRLDEYYPTRTELGILEERAAEIAGLAGPCCALIEYGSGAGIKIRLLLDELEETVAYVPIDISAEQLERVAAELDSAYPDLEVIPVEADYTAPLILPAFPKDARPLAFFPGSTIGNFSPADAAAFLRRIRRTVGTCGALLLGVDRRKDPRILEAAYNDSEGVTAAFNLNVLERLNREYGAEFDLSAFRHEAVWNDEASRIEMHLRSLRDHTVCVSGRDVTFTAGETIWTESSYKYDEARLARLVNAAGFDVDHLWTDADGYFWMCWLTANETGRDC